MATLLLKRTGINYPLFVARPACVRCGHRDRRGLANVRGLMLCGVCHLYAIARFRLVA